MANLQHHGNSSNSRICGRGQLNEQNKRKNTDPIQGLRKSKRLKSVPMYFAKNFRSYHILPEALIASLTVKEPKTVKEVMKSREWRITMREEYDALVNNRTWSLVPFITKNAVKIGRFFGWKICQ